MHIVPTNLLLVLLLLPTCAMGAVTVRPRQLDAKPTAFHRVEWVIDPAQTYSNPFDPHEVSIDARFAGPDGQVIVLPAFWNQDFAPTPENGDVNEPLPLEKPHWLVRFAPTVAGKWSLRGMVRDKSGERLSDPMSFDVSSSDRPGFIRRVKGNPRYFQYDSGKPYFMIGLNIAWPGHRQRAEAYEPYFDALSKNGGNFARVWMCHPVLFLEDNKTGLGKYDLFNAKHFDDVLSMAEQRGIGVMLTFINHRDFLDRDMWGDAIWPVNPYNAKLGGPATRPADFFTNDTAKKLFKQRLRYIVARYSAFTSLAFWELINEQEYARCETPTAWSAEMARYLKQIDPYAHLVTTSSKVPDELWKLADIDLTQRHIYGDGSQYDVFTPIGAGAREFDRFNKPHLVAEFGIDHTGTDAPFDSEGLGTTLHNSLWAGALSGAAGATAYWWWDSYIQPKNLWREYAPLSKFAAQIDWPRRKFEPLVLTTPPQRASSDPETFSNLNISSTLGWGKAHGNTIQVSRGGQVSAPLPRFIYGREKAELRTPTVLQIDLPAESTMTVRVARVSDHAVLRVFIDEQPAADFAFSALPQSPDQTNSKELPDHPGTWQADVNRERRLKVPAGKHTIAIDNLGSDWVTLDSITFTGAKSSRYADLAALALRDTKTGETILWLLDTNSNWKTDQSGPKPREQDDVVLTLPPIASQASASLAVEWWNTRGEGGVIGKQTLAPGADGTYSLRVPKFTRDVALRALPAASTSSSSP